MYDLESWNYSEYNQEIRQRVQWDARAKIPLGVVKLKKRKKWCVRDTPAASSRCTPDVFSRFSWEGTWVAAWHFAGFMRPLRMVPGPVHLSPLNSLLASPFFHLVHAFGLFVESPLLDKVLCRLGPWWMPVAWAPAFQSTQWAATESTHADRSASSTPKRHASSFVNRPAARHREGFRFACVPCVRARIYIYIRCREFTERKRAVSFILCFSPEVLSSNLTLLLCPTIFRENKRAVPDYVLRKSAEMTFNKPQIYRYIQRGINICCDNFVNVS